MNGLAKTCLNRLPNSRFARFVRRYDAQVAPQFVECAEHRSFGQLFPQRVLNLSSTQGALAFQRSPNLQHQGRNPAGTRGARSPFPLLVATQRKNEGEGVWTDQKIRLFGVRSQQIDRKSVV